MSYPSCPVRPPLGRRGSGRVCSGGTRWQGDARAVDTSTCLRDLFGLHERTALVTGGSSGIGRAIALALGGAGAHVLIVARTATAVDATVAAPRAAGGSGDGIVTDLSTREGTHALADAVGTPDILVNLDAPFILGQRLAPGMADRGFGRIIHLSSQQAHRPFAMRGAYGVSKAALEALARSQSEAWAPHGVTANVLAPGVVRTPLNERLSSNPDTVRALAERTLIGRNGVPEDFAGVAVFLASTASAYVVGQTIFVDGGFSVH